VSPGWLLERLVALCCPLAVGAICFLDFVLVGERATCRGSLGRARSDFSELLSLKAVLASILSGVEFLALLESELVMGLGLPCDTTGCCLGSVSHVSCLEQIQTKQNKKSILKL
jgi:hypothetical protein